MFDVDAANASLLHAYEAAWPAIKKVVKETPGASGAHLVRIPDGLADVPVRVAIVGMQTADTHSADAAGRSLSEQLNRYSEDGVVASKRHTLFWIAARGVTDAIVGQKNAPFVWTNLVAMDVDGDSPSKSVRDAIREAIPECGLLRHVLDAVKPDVVVFFTGPDDVYVDEMRQQFPDSCSTMSMATRRTRSFGWRTPICRPPHSAPTTRNSCG